MTLRMRATIVSQQDGTGTLTHTPQELFEEASWFQVCSRTIHFLTAFFLAVAVAWCMGSMSSKQDKTPVSALHLHILHLHSQVFAGPIVAHASWTALSALQFPLQRPGTLMRSGCTKRSLLMPRLLLVPPMLNCL